MTVRLIQTKKEVKWNSSTGTCRKVHLLHTHVTTYNILCSKVGLSIASIFDLLTLPCIHVFVLYKSKIKHFINEYICEIPVFVYIILVFHCHSACIYVNTYTSDIYTCISTAHMPTCKYWQTDNQPQPTQVQEGTSSALPQTPCQGTAAHVWHRTSSCPKWVNTNQKTQQAQRRYTPAKCLAHTVCAWDF